MKGKHEEVLQRFLYDMYLQSDRERAPDAPLSLFKQELLDAGFPIDLLEESWNYMPKYRKTIVPIAAKYFGMASTMREKEYLLRWFRYRGLHEMVPILLDEIDSVLRRDPADARSYLWSLADTLYMIRDPHYAEQYLALIQDDRMGSARQMLVSLLGQMKYEPAYPVFAELLHDPQVTIHAMGAIADFGRAESLPLLEPFLQSSNSVYRKYGKRAVERIQKKISHSPVA